MIWGELRCADNYNQSTTTIQWKTMVFVAVCHNFTVGGGGKDVHNEFFHVQESTKLWENYILQI